MTNKACIYPVQAATFRVTELDQCGTPVYDSCAYAVTDGYTAIEITQNETEGQTFQLANASGRYLVNQKADDVLNWMDVKITMGVYDPEIFFLMTGADIFLDYAGLSAGNAITDTNYGTGKFALEIWLYNKEEVCGSGNLPYYSYILLPFLVNGKITESLTFQNDVITYSLAARTRLGSPWGTGPYNVMLNELLAPSPLPSAISSDTHYLQAITQYAPPEPDCGCLALTS